MRARRRGRRPAADPGLPLPPDRSHRRGGEDGASRSTSRKGSFSRPGTWSIAVEKARDAGAAGVLVTERGTSFGYNALVADMRALPILKETTGAPVVLRRDPRRAAARRTRRVVGRRAAFCSDARPRRRRHRRRRDFYRDASRSRRGDLGPRDASAARRAWRADRGTPRLR